MKYSKHLVLSVVAAVSTALAVAGASHGATVIVSGATPVVDGADVAMLNQEGVSANGKLWTDTPVLGQTFTTGGTSAWLDSITVQIGTSAPVTKTYSLRIGEISGTSLSVLATESGTQNADINAGDYMTFTLDTPVFLWSDTQYGFDVAMTNSTTGWQSGIPYLNQNTGTNYADGGGYTTGAQHIPGETINIGGYDRVFHLNLTAVEAPVLTLQVDQVTGGTTLLGHSSQDISMNYYQIASESGSLDKADWVSLADQDFEGSGEPSGFGDGWEEAGSARSGALAEAFLLGNSTIGVGQSVSLGKGFDPAVGAEDLVFTYRTDTGKIVEGLVEYVSSVPLGDANWDGVVDAADYVMLKRNFGGAPSGAGNGGDLNDDGIVDLTDLQVLAFAMEANNAGETVPEPGVLSLMVIGGLALLKRRRS